MSNNVSDLRDTIVPKSDQLNADQLLGGPITVTVTDVRRGSGDDQPVVIHYEGEGGRPFKPCKSMRKVLVFAWGPDGTQWVGRSMTLYNRPDVKFGGEAVGGIRISHLSHIPQDIAVSLTATRGKKEQTRIARLKDVSSVAQSKARLEAAARGGMSDLQAAWKALPADHRQSIGGAHGCPAELKAVAQQADAATSSSERSDAPTVDAGAIHDRLLSAADLDALNDAAAEIELVTDAEARAALTALYAERGEALSAQ